MEIESQIATTREQSKRLLDLGIKPETADMVYHYTNSRVEGLKWELRPHPPTLRGKYWTPQRISKLASPWHKNPDGTPMTGEQVFDHLWSKDIPAWSLSRLLALFPIQKYKEDTTLCLYRCEDGGIWTLGYLYEVESKNLSPIEDCVSLIEWLVENGRFNKEYLKEEQHEK